MNNYILVLVLVFFCSCKKDGSAVTVQQDVTSEQRYNTLKDSLQLKECSGFTGDWAEIISFENELKRVLTTETQVEKDLELLKKLMVDVKDTYPKRFKTLTIEARVKVLETEVLMLEQNLKDRYLTDVLNKKIRIQNAYNVFIGQIEAQIYKERDYEKYN